MALYRFGIHVSPMIQLLILSQTSQCVEFSIYVCTNLNKLFLPFKVRNESRDCWAVAFGNSYNNDERCVCAGFDNGDVKVFDLRKLQTRWETNVRNGVCHIETQNTYCEISELAVSTTNGGLNIFTNIGEDFSQIPAIAIKDADQLSANHRSHANTIWRVKHLPQNANILATCGGSGNVRLWQRCD